MHLRLNPLMSRISRRARRILATRAPRLFFDTAFIVEGDRRGRLWLYPDGRYVFVSTRGSTERGPWHVIDGALLVFDQYVMTADEGDTFFSPWIKLRRIRQRNGRTWSNANSFFFDPAREAFEVPKLNDREEALLRALPAHAVVAEIGVETGTYSRRIIDLATPSRFHLIDCWESIPDPYPSFEEQRSNYLGVCEMFASEIADGKVVVHKGDDLEILAQFPDGYFDWVYLDTTHQYEQTLRELRACAPKMKPQGLICGHDYSDSTTSRRYGFGVVRAVNEFVRRDEWQYQWLTREEGASFVLARR